MTQDTSPARAPSFALVVLATSMAFVVGQLDVTIVNVALPAMAHTLGTGIDGLQWVVDAYTVAFAAFMLSAGALGDRFGARRAFQWGMAIFALASMGCALAPTAAGSIAIALGPVLGGLLVSGVGWPAIFWVNVPLCALGFWLSLRLDETPTGQDRPPLDIAGQLLATLLLAALIATLIESRSLGIADARIRAGAVVTILLGGALWVVERRAAAPVIAGDLFALRDFRGAVFFGTVVNGTYYGAIFVIALFLQTVRHYTPIEAGLAFLPLTAGFFLSNVLSGRAITRFGTRKPMIVGALVDLLGFGVLALASTTDSFAFMALGFLLIPTGMGLAVPAMTTTVLSAVDKSRSSLAAAILNTARQAAGAIGVAVFGALAQGGAARIGPGLRITCVASMIALAFAALAAARLKGVPPQR